MSQKEFEQAVADFHALWKNSSPCVEVRTSGSTGTPKPMQAEKSKMVTSACATCRFLGLDKGGTALLCLPVKYIAGMMMVVRADVWPLRLVVVEPSGNPLVNPLEHIHFAAFTPMQVCNIIGTAEGRRRLADIDHIIIGGGAVNPDLARQLLPFENNIWSTYGMTETLSNIAMRRLSGPGASEFYAPIEGVSLALNADQTLRISAPNVCDIELSTNDIAQLRPDGTFKIVGRKDNVINSGGIKIVADEVENILAQHLSEPFVITSAPDKLFGEAVVLITQNPHTDEVNKICRDVLPKHWQPKLVVHHHVPQTETGKPDRRAAKAIAAEAKNNH